MADKTILIELDVQEKGAISSIESLNNSLKKLDNTSEEYANILKQLQAEEAKLASIQASRVKSQGVVSKSMKKASDATGSATAATMELSRVISDAPYGIRGMANNITQLVSQLGTASTKAGGLGAALKLMGSQLMGPLGIVFAITAAVSALDYFFGAQKKAKKSSEDTTDALGKQKKELIELTEGYSDYLKLKEKVFMSNSKDREMLKALSLEAIRSDNSDKRKEVALNKLIELYPKYFKGIKVGEINKLIKAEDKVNSILENKAKLKDALISAERVSNEIQLEKLRLDKIENEGGGRPKDTPRLLALYEEQKRVRELLGIYAALDLTLKEDKDGKGKKNKKISPFKTPKELDLDVENSLKAIDKLNRSTEKQVLKNKEKEELSLATTEEQKKAIKEKYASKNLEVQIKYELKALDLKAGIEKTNARDKQKDYVKSLDEKLEAYKKSLKDENGALSDAAKKAIALATTETNEKKKASEEELRLTVFGIEEEYAKLFPFWTKLNDARRDALGIGSDEEKEDPIKAWFDKYTFYVEQAKALISGVADFVDAEFERELTIEKNKTTELNNELNKRLLNENLSKEQKESIQNQIAQNDEKLRVKQEKIARKRFKVMKAFNLATALADTYLATQKAYTSQLQLDPTSPIRAKIAAGVALAAGLANVAAIARTKFESSSGTSPAILGGNSTGGGQAEPSFNIVGRSNDNLLLNAIQSQFDQPLRAYVVARDVTNQQQMDGIITDAAGT
jgi:hypothetical protein